MYQGYKKSFRDSGRTYHSSNNRGRFGAGRGSGFGGRGKRGGGFGASRSAGRRIDVSKFVNKTTEEESAATFTPKNEFHGFPINEVLKTAVLTRGYKTPTPIQDESIPYILDGKDVVGTANTGTGKTGAFLIPLINKVLNDKNHSVLIMVPTRELAIQIDQEFRAFCGRLRLFSVCVVGGAPIGKQMAELRRTHQFVIGTPGRIKDLVRRRNIHLPKFGTVVLDEADRMLDMGFIADMRFITSQLPKERQTLFFTATLSQEIEKLITEFLKEPIRISLKTRDTSKNVDQDIVKINKGDNKVEVLHNLLITPGFDKVLIFGKTKHGVEDLSKHLLKRGFKSESIHGDKNHSKRQRALHSFKQNQSKILVATDVAARGLDISDITHVINYDLPATYEDYIHRIGRTGRGDKKGKALTFVV